MIRLLSTALPLLLLFACAEPFSNAPFDDDRAYLAAAPRAVRLQLGGPGLAGPAAGGLIVAEPAEFYVYTRTTMRHLNGTALRLLHDVDRLLESAPDTRSSEHREWAPAAHALDPLEHRFRMTRTDEGFDYTLTQRRRRSDAPFVPTLYGHFAPETGEGHLTVDLDAVGAVHGTALGGALYLEYHLDGDTTRLVMRFDGYDFGEGGLDATYRFERAPDGSGAFDFGGPGDEGDWIEIRTRWQVDGAGRADVYAGPYVVSECWDTEFAAIERTTTLGAPPAEPRCAFAEASRPESTRPDAP